MWIAGSGKKMGSVNVTQLLMREEKIKKKKKINLVRDEAENLFRVRDL